MHRTKAGTKIPLDTIRTALKKHKGPTAKAAKELGMTIAELKKCEAQIDELFDIETPPAHHVQNRNQFEAAQLPSATLPIPELLEKAKEANRLRIQRHKAEHLVDIKIKTDGPIGIMHIGDPHLDDEGCDLDGLEKHVKTIQKTDGLFAGGLGDLQNNWIGRLARLYANQSMTTQESWAIAEWYIQSIDWLYLIQGNHDMWAGNPNALDFIGKNTLIGMHSPHKARLRLNLPSGTSLTVHARHNFAGHSQWNPLHGIMKAIQMGWRDNIIIGGHKHTSAYSCLVDPMSGRISHGIQVSSYKKGDEYAVELGCMEQDMFCAPVTIVNPDYNEDDIRFIKFIPDPEEAADYLTFMRKRHNRGASTDLNHKTPEDAKKKPESIKKNPVPKRRKSKATCAP